MLVPAPSAKFFGFLWLCFPLVIIAASKSLPEEKRRSEKSKNTVRSYARDMWRFFAAHVSEETNFLPPDNYQISPEERTAMRTSPTNIGLYLLSLLAARDFDFIDSEKLHFYAEKSGKSIEKLLSWRGHLYNWYDISTLSAIGEPFVSSVDSGNFVTALVAFCEGLREYASQEPRLLSDIALYENSSHAPISRLSTARQSAFSISATMRKRHIRKLILRYLHERVPHHAILCHGGRLRTA